MPLFRNSPACRSTSKTPKRRLRGRALSAIGLTRGEKCNAGIKACQICPFLFRSGVIHQPKSIRSGRLRGKREMIEKWMADFDLFGLDSEAASTFIGE